MSNANSFKSYPDRELLEEFIDLKAWDDHSPEAVERKYPLALVINTNYDSEKVPEMRGVTETSYWIEVQIPEIKLDQFIEALEAKDWEVEMDEAELIDGWYEQVTINKSEYSERPVKMDAW